MRQQLFTVCVECAPFFGVPRPSGTPGKALPAKPEGWRLAEQPQRWPGATHRPCAVCGARTETEALAEQV